MSDIAVILPQLGRLELAQTAVIKMHKLAACEHEFYVVHPTIESEFWSHVHAQLPGVRPLPTDDHVTYAEKLNFALTHTLARHVVYVGNDVLAGRDWLAILMNTGMGARMVATNDGVHAGRLACHAMIHRDLLTEWYGEDKFPTCYRHWYIDTELMMRARRDCVFYAQPWSVLYHHHPVTCGETDDVYTAGQSSASADHAVFMRRMAEAGIEVRT